MEAMKSIKERILKKINQKGGYQYKDLLDHNEHGWSPLMRLLYSYNHNFNMSESELDYLVRNSNLSQTEVAIRTNALLLHILYNDRNQNKLGTKSVDYLLKNSDLNHTDHDGDNALICFLAYNRERPYPLNDGQIDYLIENSELPKTIWHETKKMCPIVVAAQNNHKDYIIIKLIEKRIKENPRFFNKTYFKKIKDKIVCEKIKRELDVVITKKEIDMKLNSGIDPEMGVAKIKI